MNNEDSFYNWITISQNKFIIDSSKNNLSIDYLIHFEFLTQFFDEKPSLMRIQIDGFKDETNFINLFHKKFSIFPGLIESQIGYIDLLYYFEHHFENYNNLASQLFSPAWQTIRNFFILNEQITSLSIIPFNIEISESDLKSSLNDLFVNIDQNKSQDNFYLNHLKYLTFGIHINKF